MQIMRNSLPGAARSATGWRDVETDGDAFEFGTWCRVAAHDERVVAGNDVIGRIGQAKQEIEAFEHFGDIVNNGEWAALFEVVVEVRSVGGEDDVTAARPNAGALQAGGMATDAMDGEAGSEFVVAVVEDGSFRINMADHLENVFEIERRTKFAMAHGAAGGEGHFAILQMKTRDREAVEIAGVVVMKMRDDYVHDAIGIEADEAQGIDWMANPVTAAANGGFVSEAGIEDEGAIAAPCNPDEVIEIRGKLVRVGGDKIFLWVPIAKMAVTNGEKLKWFDGHASLSAIVISAGGIG